MIYFSLFISAFLAATLLPLSSELLLASLILSGKYNLMGLWFYATLGNVTGSITNWFLGRYFIGFVSHDRAREIFLKYGIWTLLFAWLPVIGDPLTIIAGLFRVPILLFILLVLLGKGTRYLIIIFLVT
jgi:membrane protein YqaA with SNARE-associated domain